MVAPATLTRIGGFESFFATNGSTKLPFFFRGVAQMVARLVRDQEARVQLSSLRPVKSHERETAFAALLFFYLAF